MPRQDAREFDRLYEEYYASLCRFAFGLLRHDDVAREIVSDVFANVWLHWERWPPPVGEGPYLYRAVRNRVHNHARDLRRREARTRDTREPSDFGMGAPDDAPDVAVESSDTMRRVWTAIAALPPKGREVLTLHWRHQLTLAEIALVLEMREGAVRVQHSRALKQLRAQLGDLFS